MRGPWMDIRRIPPARMSRFKSVSAVAGLRKRTGTILH
ncbi:hypothetical protein ASZ90_009386 [hydrocarbon metagenome]|uniref:Uncharacterized protein n=1 Tax=hydrocarbon metagenome TaxID=938273 RepID=A0A0W8FJD3_9ZZZZ